MVHLGGGRLVELEYQYMGNHLELRSILGREWSTCGGGRLETLCGAYDADGAGEHCVVGLEQVCARCFDNKFQLECKGWWW